MNAFRNDPDGVFVKWARGMASGLKKPVLEIKGCLLEDAGRCGDIVEVYAS